MENNNFPTTIVLCKKVCTKIDLSQNRKDAIEVTIEDEIKYACNRLKNAGKQDAKTQVIRVLQYILKCNRQQLVFNDKKELEKEPKEEFETAIGKLESGFPIQYILNEQEFMKLKFYVDQNVLIPQPDTEILVQEIIDNVIENPISLFNFNKVNKKFSNKQKFNDPIKILDLCTGSGCIGISCAYYLPNSLVTLSDVKKNAIEIAKFNAEKNGVHNRTKYVESDLWEKIEGKFNIIVSNPPYIRTQVIPTLEMEVQKEPMIALDGGIDGLKFYYLIINQAYLFLEDEGLLVLEIGFDQKQDVLKIIEDTNKYKDVYVKKDFGGNDRMIVARRK